VAGSPGWGKRHLPPPAANYFITCDGFKAAVALLKKNPSRNIFFQFSHHPYAPTQTSAPSSASLYESFSQYSNSACTRFSFSPKRAKGWEMGADQMPVSETSSALSSLTLFYASPHNTDSSSRTCFTSDKNAPGFPFLLNQFGYYENLEPRTPCVSGF